MKVETLQQALILTPKFSELILQHPCLRGADAEYDRCALVVRNKLRLRHVGGDRLAKLVGIVVTEPTRFGTLVSPPTVHFVAHW